MYVQEENDTDLGLFTIKMINCVHTDAIKLDTKLNVHQYAWNWTQVPWCQKECGERNERPSSWKEPPRLTQLPVSQAVRPGPCARYTYKNQSASLPILVASGDGPSFGGTAWLNTI